MAGRYTTILAERLEKVLEGYEIYYDHRDASSRTPVYYGEYSWRNILSFVDIAVVKDNDVRVICEIEETSSTPKKVLGDLVSILLGERIRCGDRELSISSPHILIGLVVRERGVKSLQVSGMIERFSEIFDVDTDRIMIVFSESPDELVEGVEKAVVEILESYISITDGKI